MKKLILVFSIFFAGVAFAQEMKVNPDAEKGEVNLTNQISSYDITEPTDYILNNQKFNFIPGEHGIKVVRIVDGEEISYGTLRKSTDDGFYILTCTDDTDDVSFGRFDKEGNFVCNRFDMETERIIEENYTLMSLASGNDKQ